MVHCVSRPIPMSVIRNKIINRVVIQGSRSRVQQNLRRGTSWSSGQGATGKGESWWCCGQTNQAWSLPRFRISLEVLSVRLGLDNKPLQLTNAKLNSCLLPGLECLHKQTSQLNQQTKPYWAQNKFNRTETVTLCCVKRTCGVQSNVDHTLLLFNVPRRVQLCH
jgi:hypothetical protein